MKVIDLLVFLGDLGYEEVGFAVVFGAEGGDFLLVVCDGAVEGGLEVVALSD